MTRPKAINADKNADEFLLAIPEDLSYEATYEALNQALAGPHPILRKKAGLVAILKNVLQLHGYDGNPYLTLSLMDIINESEKTFGQVDPEVILSNIFDKRDEVAKAVRSASKVED